MGLNQASMIGQLNKALEDSDKELAADLGIPEKDFNNPQKKKERLSMATTIATMIFKVLTEQAEIELPDHPSNMAQTGPGGSPPHPHSTNVAPVPHDIGKII